MSTLISGLIFIAVVVICSNRKYLMKLFKKKKYQSIDGMKWSNFERAVLLHVNRYRESRDLDDLKPDDKFYVEAHKRAEIQAEHGKLSHDRMDITTENLIPFGIKFTGENLAKGWVTSERLVQEWIASLKHHKNIVNPRWKYTGIAKVLDENGKTWYCQTFGY